MKRQEKAAQKKVRRAELLAGRARSMELNRKACVLMAAMEHIRAVPLLVEADRLAPDSAATLSNLGECLRAVGRLDDARQTLERAVRLDPDCFWAHLNLGAALGDAGRMEEALAALTEAVRIKPFDPLALTNQAGALRMLGDFDAAVRRARAAVACDPRFGPARFVLGMALCDLKNTKAGLEELQRAVELDPSNALAWFNLASAFLLHGDLRRGFELYEWRLRLGVFHGLRPEQTGLPRWRGEAPAGKTLVLASEQGAGDTIQFARYALLLRRAGARVVFWGERGLGELLRSSGVCDAVVVAGDELPWADYQVAMGSLPHLFQTSPETVPAPIPYLTADSQRAAWWRERLAALPGRKVGLVWAGNPLNPADRLRSATPADFAPLFSVAGVSWVSLQKGWAGEPLGGVAGGERVLDVMGEVDSFGETAAIIAALDLVIAVDTSVAHLAGAMGKPVWLLSRVNGCWRWLLEREDSPWYPTLRLFRQTQARDWAPVVASVATELAGWVAAS